MSEGTIILLFLLALVMIANNNLIVGAILTVLLLKWAHMDTVLRWLNQNGISFGFYVLILTILVPFAENRIGIERFKQELLSPVGLVAIAASALGTHMAAHGVTYLRSTPEVLVGLVVGSVVGVIFLGGVPNGPLIAAGLTALLMRILSWIT